MKNIVIIVIAIAVAVVFAEWYVGNLTDKNVDLKMQLNSCKQKKSQPQSTWSDQSNKRKSGVLNRIARQIRPLPSESLVDRWRSEYGCYRQGQCLYPWLNANSFAEALWMKRSGYLPQSRLNTVHDHEYFDFKALADEGSVTARKILAVYWLMQGDVDKAKPFAISARSREPVQHTFTLRLLADIYQQQQLWFMMAVELNQIIALGDGQAQQAYEQVVQQLDVNRLADAELLSQHYLSSKWIGPVPTNYWDQRPSP